MPFFSRNKRPRWPKYMVGSMIGFLLMIFLMYIMAPATEGPYIKDHWIELIIVGITVAVVLRLLVQLYDKFQGYDL
jgi:flagellar biosynthesis protein FliR